MIRSAALVTLACVLPSIACAEAPYPSAANINLAGLAVCELSILTSAAQRCLDAFDTLTIVSVGIRMKTDRVANYSMSLEYREITAKLKHDLNFRIDQFSQPDFSKE